MKKQSGKLIEDVACASAAELWNNLPALAKLPCVEGFERLADCFRTAFLAYFDALNDWGLPEPSTN